MISIPFIKEDRQRLAVKIAVVLVISLLVSIAAGYRTRYAPETVFFLIAGLGTLIAVVHQFHESPTEGTRVYPADEIEEVSKRATRKVIREEFGNDASLNDFEQNHSIDDLIANLREREPIPDMSPTMLESKNHIRSIESLLPTSVTHELDSIYNENPDLFHQIAEQYFNTTAEDLPVGVVAEMVGKAASDYDSNIREQLQHKRNIEDLDESQQRLISQYLGMVALQNAWREDNADALDFKDLQDLPFQDKLILIEALTYWAHSSGEDLSEIDDSDPRRKRATDMAQILLQSEDIPDEAFTDIIDDPASDVSSE
ncbi:hypothetical protein [Haloarcula sp. 1CSR25-25]|uniref:hypothetical protein n=1 Tax=Haloarcula sp. 1CSR25-25 TaxID=2862545 RepID=UPI002893AAC4|nr:hypothetical protein [Haloarcula sp. 1CSR25-25]MDT3437427.1 hypothetical protein [Haloarcula sp. 1CSR25-25]